MDYGHRSDGRGCSLVMLEKLNERKLGFERPENDLNIRSARDLDFAISVGLSINCRSC